MKSVLVPLAEGFEEIEAVAIIDVLRRADVKVTTGAIGASLHVKGAHGIVVSADKMFAEAEGANYDAIVLPGGPAYQLLMNDPEVIASLKRHEAEGKIVAAICASPAVLAKAGVLHGRRAACYPSVEADVAKVATIVHSSVCVDGRIVTSRGPSTAVVFAVQLVAELVGETRSRQVASDMLLQN